MNARFIRIFKKDFCYGYTLIEAMLAMAISSILMAGLYQTFHSQQRHYIAHEESHNVTQNLRTGIYFLTKEIRSAGFNPAGITSNIIGFVENFPPINIFEDIGKGDIDYTTDRDRIAFSLDKNSDRCIDADNKNASLINCSLSTKDPNAPNEDGARGEQIAYRIHDEKLQRFNSEVYSDTGKLSDAWQTIATNVDALDFVFLDQNGDPINDPLNNLSQLEAIEITLLVRTGNRDHKYKNTNVYQNKQGDILCPSCYDDHYHRRQLSTIVDLRNF